MELILGDCLDQLKKLKDNSIDAIVTDPPYGLSFMGKKWDYDVPSVDIWKECLRVLKPGGYLLSFAGTRTQHRMAVNIEDAGFEIRDMIAWVYGSGFPKSLNIGKAVDKLQGNERIKIGDNPNVRTAESQKSTILEGGFKEDNTITKGTSQWEGWGTALKPALEPITVARKPLGEKTVAENCLKWGVGGINIDGCRVESNEQIETGRAGRSGASNFNASIGEKQETHQGRFPANLIHDGSDEVVGLFPQTKSGKLKSDCYEKDRENDSMFAGGENFTHKGYEADSGSAARFFYCAKASKKERNMGCEGLEEKYTTEQNKWTENDYRKGNGEKTKSPVKNSHPTVKPLALMEYLVKLVSREGQVVLDPFMGSGTTGMACKKLNREFVGIEMMEEYMEIAKARIEGTKKEEQLSLV